MRDCNYRDEKLHAMLISKVDCTAGDKNCFKALGSFGSFLKLYMSIQIETFMHAIMSHKKQRAKYQTEMLLRIAKQLF